MQTVDVLHLVDDVVLHGRGTLDAQDVGRRDSTVRERCTGTHVVVLLHQNLLAQWHQILLDLAQTAGDNNLAITALDTAEGHLAVNLADHSGVGRVAGLEELGDTRQTARDVTGATRRCARNLDKRLAGGQLLALVKEQMSTHRQRVGLDDLAVLVDKLSLGDARVILALDDDLLAVARSLVDLGAIGDAIDQVVKPQRATHLTDDDGIEGVPLGNLVTFLDLGSVLEVELRAIDDSARCERQTGVGIDDAHLGHATDDDVDTILVLDRAQLLKLEDTVVLRDHLRLGGLVAGHTTGVERTQGQLRARLAD